MTREFGQLNRSQEAILKITCPHCGEEIPLVYDTAQTKEIRFRFAKSALFPLILIVIAVAIAAQFIPNQ